MILNRIVQSAVLLVLLAMTLTGCGTRLESVSDGGNAQAQTLSGLPAVAPDRAGTGTIDATAQPGELRRFLEEQQIANGDIYLKDGRVYVNIVGLTDQIGQLLADRYLAGTYRTVDVAHTIGELQAAQQLLTDQDLYRTLDLYSSGIDVIANKVTVTMPDSSEAAAKPALEKLIDPDLLSYHIQQVSETPEFVGTIVNIDAAARRILILEEGKQEPSIYFSFNEHSVLSATDRSPITFDDLKIKQHVRLWTTGMINDSMPAQATARKLELVDQPAP